MFVIMYFVSVCPSTVRVVFFHARACFSKAVRLWYVTDGSTVRKEVRVGQGASFCFASGSSYSAGIVILGKGASMPLGS